MDHKDRLMRRFRKLSVAERRSLLSELYLSDDELVRDMTKPEVLDQLSDLMIESSFGYFAVPMGLAQGFMIDGKEYSVPMATEEPSVIAAASYGASLVKKGGGFSTWADEPVMTAQLYMQLPQTDISLDYPSLNKQIDERLREVIPSIYKRGGGFKGVSIASLPETNTLRFHVDIDVRDAMGANIVNTAVESLKPLLEKMTGGRTVMGILTNSAPRRRAGASFAIPCTLFSRGGLSGDEVAARIVLAAQIAAEDPARAVTHNKGIMNGISALTLATGNDTRGMEAAAHGYAAVSGGYTSLSSFSIEGDCLKGELIAPFPLGSVGGAVQIHPASRIALKLLGEPNAPQLARIAASVGLAQNLAALRALVSEGIQEGHMKLHATRVAWQAGARGSELAVVATRMWQENSISSKSAQKVLHELRNAKEESDSLGAVDE